MSPTQAGQTKSVLCFGRGSTRNFGISTIFLPCEVLREYFYRLPRAATEPIIPLCMRSCVSQPALRLRLRVAFKLRDLELRTAGVRHSERVALERAFNIVGQPELRACYDALLADPEAPAVFPYGGFGSLLVAGEPSRDGETFFAAASSRFHPISGAGASVCRCADVISTMTGHCAATCAASSSSGSTQPPSIHSGIAPGISGSICWEPKSRSRARSYRAANTANAVEQWELVTWETALPSRLEVKLPSDFHQEIESAKIAYHRFGQYSRALDQIRLCLEHRAVERAELERMCSELRIPGDFGCRPDEWRPDYDPFFYRQLARRARRIYLFREEYIFDVEKAVVVETPQLGHATYVFAKPQSMETFLALYTKITKDDVRRNRNNAAERLGFLGRVIHGTNPRAWLKEVRQRVGEGIDFAASELRTDP